MKTYVFAQKNGNATLTLSANDEKEAYDTLKELTSVTFRLQEVIEE